MSHQVFISYSHIDKQVADALCHHLEENSIRCWIAPRDINPGSSWSGAIADAIPNSKVLIIILSAESNSSEQVIREVEIAVNHRLVIIPIRIEDIMPTGGMSYFLSNTHWIDAIDRDISKKINILTERIKNILNIVEEPERLSPEGETNLPEAEKPALQTTGKNITLRKSTVIVLLVVLFVIIGITIFLLRGVIFNKGDNSINNSSTGYINTEEQIKESNTATDDTPEKTSSPMPAIVTPVKKMSAEDFGWDANMTVDIPDIKLKECLMGIFAETGVDITENNIRISDMLKLESLVILPLDWQGGYWIGSGDLNDKYIGSMYIHYSDNQIADLTGLEYAQNLKYMAIPSKELTELNALKQLYNLEFLCLSTDSISDLTFLAGMENLAYLNLGGCSMLEDISSLKNLKKIEDLIFEGCENISDFSVLAELSEIKVLWMGKTRFSHITLLDSMENLSLLALEGTNINADDLANLTNRRNLKTLEIGGLGISDISFLHEFESLESLVLSNNNINDISILSNLKHINSIDMHNNNITDLNPLKGMNIYQIRIDQDTYDGNSEIIGELTKNNCQIYIGDE